MGYKIVVTLQDKTNLICKLAYYNSETNRISRENLASSLGWSLRKLRATVHAINADETDHLVLTDTDEGGYWLRVVIMPRRYATTTRKNHGAIICQKKCQQWSAKS